MKTLIFKVYVLGNGVSILLILVMFSLHYEFSHTHYVRNSWQLSHCIQICTFFLPSEHFHTPYIYSLPKSLSCISGYIIFSLVWAFCHAVRLEHRLKVLKYSLCFFSFSPVCILWGSVSFEDMKNISWIPYISKVLSRMNSLMSSKEED